MNLHGYLLEKNFFTAEQLEVVKSRILTYARSIFKIDFKNWKDMNAALPQLSIDFPDKRKKLYDFSQLCPEISGFVSNEKVQNVLKEQGFTNPILKNTNIRLDIPESCDFFLVDWHQDLNNLDGDKSLTFWIPLHDLNDETGGIFALDVPGFELKQYPGEKVPKGYERVIVESIPGSKPLDLQFKQGDALVFAPFLIHKSKKGTSAPRWTLILRFDCLDSYFEITGKERSFDKFVTDDPFLRQRNAKNAY